MDKYRKVLKPKEETAKSDEEIRVTAAGSVSAYVSRAATVFNELKKPYVIVQATGNALTKAVTAAEVIKRRFKGLHQITELKTVEIVDEYEPIEEGLDKVTDTRNVSVIEIKLSKEELDSSNKGYQPPLRTCHVAADEVAAPEKAAAKERVVAVGLRKAKAAAREKASPRERRAKGLASLPENLAKVAKAKERVPRESMKMTLPPRAREKARARARARASTMRSQRAKARAARAARAARTARAARAKASPRAAVTRPPTPMLRPAGAPQARAGPLIGPTRIRATASPRAGEGAMMITAAKERAVESRAREKARAAKVAATATATTTEAFLPHRT